jgi:RimJ/RimL family protein N-acetyltransferase
VDHRQRKEVAIVQPRLPVGNVPEWLRSSAGDVVLRRPRPEDVAALASHVGTEAGWLSAPQGLLADPVGLLDEYQAGWQGAPNRLGLSLVVADPVTDRLAGMVHLSRLGDDGGLWVSYGIAPELRGRRIAQRALQLVCAWALSSGGYLQVLLDIPVDNAVGQRVAERTGFRRIRHDRIVVKKPTKQRHESWIYARP